MVKLTLDSTLKQLHGVGVQQQALLARLGLHTVADLLNYQPYRFEDFSQVTPIVYLEPGQVTIKAQVYDVRGHYVRGRSLHITEGLAQDDTGFLRITWFNQPYRAQGFKARATYYLSGQYELRYGRLQLFNPSVILADDQEAASLIRPVYSTTAGLKVFQIRKILKQAQPLLATMPESLPAWLCQQAQFQPLGRTLQHLHFPATMEQANQALAELEMREIFAFSLSSQLLKQKLSQQASVAITYQKKLVADLIANLSFQLTDQQAELVAAILAEMAQGKKPLNRLIQGDVSAGKTVVAALIAANVIANGYQVAFLAPTQLLAQQHYRTLVDILGTDSASIEVLTGDMPAKEKNQLLRRLKDNQLQLLIGTHAMLSPQVQFGNLGLVIIDEQHRFGVEQRLQLVNKTPSANHVLTLSATPIPRSLALTLYADLDISQLTQKPRQRQSITTTIVALKERDQLLKQILQTKSATNLIYMLCPAIDDANIADSLQQIKAHLTVLEPNLNYAVLHGQLSVPERTAIMSQFMQGQFEVLLCTSIVGAGLDIPQANTMVIFSPERFGLAQLHQFRGRVGRADQAGACYLLTNSDQAPSPRLQILLNCDDGFELSEHDLRLRGPGLAHGWRQSGPSLLPVGLTDNVKVELMIELAQQFLAQTPSLTDYPLLQARVRHYQQITHLN